MVAKKHHFVSSKNSKQSVWYPAFISNPIPKQMSARIRFWSHNLVPHRNTEKSRIQCTCEDTGGRGFEGFCRTACVVFPWRENPTTSASELADMQSCHADWWDRDRWTDRQTRGGRDRWMMLIFLDWASEIQCRVYLIVKKGGYSKTMYR